MRILIILLMVLASVGCAPRDYSDQEIVRAIYVIEGGHHAKFQYGIRSVHYANIKEARSICFRTVRHARRRWEAAGRPGSFLSYLAGIYCPLEVANDPRGLNKNWLKNIKEVLRKEAR